jgi:hypothetical protein
MKKNLFTTIILVGTIVMALILNSCASIIGKSGPETLSLRSTPDRAAVVIADETGAKIFEGKTPTTLSLEKKKGFFSGKKYTVTISLAGYTDHTFTVDTRANGWYIAGNLVFGGLIGWLIVDPLTGAMWTLDTNDINVALEASTHANSNNSNAPGIILLSQVPSDLRSHMVKIK